MISRDLLLLCVFNFSVSETIDLIDYVYVVLIMILKWQFVCGPKKPNPLLIVHEEAWE